MEFHDFVNRRMRKPQGSNLTSQRVLKLIEFPRLVLDTSLAGILLQKVRIITNLKAAPQFLGF